MSKQPSPPPISYATPAPRYYRANQRPASVTSVATVVIVIGVVGLLGVFMRLLPAVGLRPTAPIIQAYEQNGVMYAWHLFGTLTGLVLTVVLLIGGTKSLSLKPIGRRLLMFYAWCRVAIAIPSLLIVMLYIEPMVQQWATLHKVHSMPLVTMRLILLLTVFVGLCIDFWIIYVMTRPHVKATFANRASGDL